MAALFVSCVLEKDILLSHCLFTLSMQYKCMSRGKLFGQPDRMLDCHSCSGCSKRIGSPLSSCHKRNEDLKAENYEALHLTLSEHQLRQDLKKNQAEKSSDIQDTT